MVICPFITKRSPLTIQQPFTENHQAEYLTTCSCTCCHTMFERLSDHIEIVGLQSPSPRRNVAFVHLGEDVHKDKLGDERSLVGTATHEAEQFGSTSEVGQGSLSPLVIKPGKQLQEA